MKTLLYLLFGLLLSISTVQAKLTPTDSLKTQQALTKQQLVELTTSLQELSQKYDSLDKELNLFRAKDDFYVMAVDRQGSHFEWLLATIIGAAGLFSYTFFQRELTKIRRDWSEQQRQQKQDFEKLKKQTSAGIFNSYMMISNMLLNSEATNYSPIDFSRMASALNNLSVSISYSRLAYSIKPVEDKKDALDLINEQIRRLDMLLNSLSTFLECVTTKEDYLEILRTQYSVIPSALDDKIAIDDINISEGMILIRRRLRQLFSNG